MAMARVYVTLKHGVLDPQGQAVHGALGRLGYGEVTDARIGKYIELKIRELSREGAAGRVREMCERLLANGVIEDFRVELSEDGR